MEPQRLRQRGDQLVRVLTLATGLGAVVGTGACVWATAPHDAVPQALQSAKQQAPPARTRPAVVTHRAAPKLVHTARSAAKPRLAAAHPRATARTRTATAPVKSHAARIPVPTSLAPPPTRTVTAVPKPQPKPVATVAPQPVATTAAS